jgi:hypothetical protein
MAIPPSASKHEHQSHFLHLLNNSLPRSGHFSPMVRVQSDKDKDLLSRLRTEIASYMPKIERNSSEETTAKALDSPVPKSSPRLGGIMSRQSSGSGVSEIGLSAGQSGPSEIKRKPSPLWMGDEMLETVGVVWGVNKEWLEQDSEEIKQSGRLEQVSSVHRKSGGKR